MAATSRERAHIDVWRLQGFPQVSSSGIAGLPTPTALLPPLVITLAVVFSPCGHLQNKETHVIEFLPEQACKLIRDPLSKLCSCNCIADKKALPQKASFEIKKELSHNYSSFLYLFEFSFEYILCEYIARKARLIFQSIAYLIGILFYIIFAYHS